MKAQGLGGFEIAKALKIGRASVYRVSRRGPRAAVARCCVSGTCGRIVRWEKDPGPSGATQGAGVCAGE
jgi:hypothetical protein